MDNQQVAINQTGVSVRLSETAISEMKEQRSMFNTFIKSQLQDKVDFGVLPGTDKPALWKPGAEKLANIFQLGSRIVKNERTVDIKENFAMFAVTIEIFHLGTGIAIAQCEGISNSQEKKYKERGVYEYNQAQRKRIKVKDEPTPIGDILNTLAKMAQKRAYVGAVIIATKASDFFDHDLAEDDEEFYEKNPNYHQDQEKVQQEQLNKAREANQKAAPQIKATEGSFDDFKGGGFKPAVVVSPEDAAKKEMLIKVNAERIRLQWTPPQMAAFIVQNFDKEGSKLNNQELELLVITLQRQGK